MNDKENLFDSHNKNFFDGNTLVVIFQILCHLLNLEIFSNKTFLSNKKK